MYNYSISIRNADYVTFSRLTADKILTALDPTNEAHKPYIHSIKKIMANGISYSNEDFDVLTGALRAAAGGNSYMALVNKLLGNE